MRSKNSDGSVFSFSIHCNDDFNVSEPEQPNTASVLYATDSDPEPTCNDTVTPSNQYSNFYNNTCVGSNGSDLVFMLTCFGARESSMWQVSVRAEVEGIESTHAQARGHGHLWHANLTCALEHPCHAF